RDATVRQIGRSTVSTRYFTGFGLNQNRRVSGLLCARSGSAREQDSERDAMRAKTHCSLTSVQSVQKRAQIFVLMPSQRDDDDIDCSNQHEPHRMCEGEAVQLITDEEAKDDDGRGVVPEFFPQKADNQPQLHTAVREQVQRHEMLGADGQILRQME